MGLYQGHNISWVGRETKDATEVDEQARARPTINELFRAKCGAELGDKLEKLIHSIAASFWWRLLI
jgi:hypothetical protein